MESPLTINHNHLADQMETNLDDSESYKQDYESGIASEMTSSPCPPVQTQPSNSTDNLIIEPIGDLLPHPLDEDIPASTTTIESNIEIVTTPIDLEFDLTQGGKDEFKLASDLPQHMMQSSPSNNSFSLCYENDSISLSGNELDESGDSEQDEDTPILQLTEHFNDKEKSETKLQVTEATPDSEKSSFVPTAGKISNPDICQSVLEKAYSPDRSIVKSLSPQISLVRSPYKRRSGSKPTPPQEDNKNSSSESKLQQSQAKMNLLATVASTKPFTRSFTTRNLRCSARIKKKKAQVKGKAATTVINESTSKTPKEKSKSKEDPRDKGEQTLTLGSKKRRKRTSWLTPRRRKKAVPCAPSPKGPGQGQVPSSRTSRVSLDSIDSDNSKTSSPLNKNRGRSKKPGSQMPKLNDSSLSQGEKSIEDDKDTNKRKKPIVNDIGLSPSTVAKRGRGRPRKSETEKTDQMLEQTTKRRRVESVTPVDSNRLRGTPRSTPSLQTNSNKQNSESSSQQNGRGNSETRSNAGSMHGEGGGSSKKRRGRHLVRQHSKSSERSEESGSSPVKKWKCEFCGLGSCVKQLGYLFGPYQVKVTTDNGRSLAHEDSELDTSVGTDDPSRKINERAVWVHAACVYWSPGVCLVGDEIMGLDEAVSIAAQTVCQACGNNGAVLCCDVRSCRQCYHYPCALEKGCQFNVDRFDITCIKHLNVNNDTTLHVQNSSTIEKMQETNVT